MSIGIPSSQPHSPPSGQFFQVVGMINSHVPLIENLFREVIAPCIKWVGVELKMFYAFNFLSESTPDFVWYYSSLLVILYYPSGFYSWFKSWESLKSMQV